MSGDAEQDYFADGMVEDIITGLSRIRWLFVIARNSTFTYKGRAVDVKQVGRELGVRYVLEGSVRKAGDRVRITGQLIDAATGAHVWADRYDRTCDDIFALQDEITRQRGRRDRAKLAASRNRTRQAQAPGKSRRLRSRATRDAVVDTGMPDGASQAMPLVERALALEPDYALAHGQAALCHEILYVRGGRREENRSGAIRHAHAAIALGPDDATALVYGGIAIGMVEHDQVLARDAFEVGAGGLPVGGLGVPLGSADFGLGRRSRTRN